MKKNAWGVANELVRRIDNAPVVGEFISLKLSEEVNEYFFINKEYILQFNTVTTDYKKKKVPGSGYASKILQFFDQLCRIGELFIEYVKNSCSENGSVCEFSSMHGWTGPLAKQIK